MMNIQTLTIDLTQNKTQKVGTLATKKSTSSTTSISTKRTKVIANNLAYLGLTK